MDTLARARWIEARAQEALRKTNQEMPPTDLDAVAQLYGIAVVRRDRWAGVVAHFDAARNEIVLGEQDRWPFAHELGHALLAHGSSSCYEGASSSDAPIEDIEAGVPFEAEANRFARHLLVPRTRLREALEDGLRGAELARRFAVSEEVIWRALLGYKLV